MGLAAGGRGAGAVLGTARAYPWPQAVAAHPFPATALLTPSCPLRSPPPLRLVVAPRTQVAFEFAFLFKVLGMMHTPLADGPLPAPAPAPAPAAPDAAAPAAK